VAEYDPSEAARRAGVAPGFVAQLIDLGIIKPNDQGRLSTADVRRTGIVSSLTGAGIPLDGLGEAIRTGRLSLAFVDSAAYERFAPLSDETFAQASARTGIPLSLLTVLREAIGRTMPAPEDRLRDDEQVVVPFIDLQLKSGFRQKGIERLLRAQGDSLRRIADAQSEWWASEVIRPAIEAGQSPADMGRTQNSDRLSDLSEKSLLAMYHAHQEHAWTQNIIAGFEAMLTRAGLYSRIERPPAMCFLDISGYTRLTQERGDVAAADLAEQLGRLVQRASMQHGGRAVKWLGDGVMFFFPDPGPGVVAALDMVDGVADAGLPPAHVGLHAGPVLFQEGDYFGQTVNVASRIAEYARPGEVLVSQAVVDASAGVGAAFRAIGPVDLKGVSGTIRLHAAHRPA
jgi:adenylate cyclase